jgi:ribonuclease HI
MPRPEVKIFIDGGARGNPGPAGFGMVVTGPGGEPWGSYFGYIGVATNNVAEYRGLVAALEHARARGWSRVWVGSDSELMVRQVRGEYRVKNEGLRPLFERCRALAAGLAEFTIEHLPREANAEADSLANQAMNLRASELPPGAGSEAPGGVPLSAAASVSRPASPAEPARPLPGMEAVRHRASRRPRVRAARQPAGRGRRAGGAEPRPRRRAG